MTDALARRIAAEKLHGEAIVAALQAGIDQFALAEAPVVPPYASATFTLEKDPYSQQATLVGSFHAASRYRCGQLLIHADGKSYGEFDVARPHPRLPGMFIEAVEAWGQGGSVKTDVRLLEMPE